MTTFTAKYTHCDIESAVKKSLGEQFAKQVDEEIIKTVEINHLVSIGWTKVELPRFNSIMHAIDINIWVEQKCGPHDRLGSTYVFKEAKDATWFRLRWCGE